MCSSFVTYYPRTNLSSCHSMTPVRYFFKALGIKSFYNFTIEEIEKYVMKLSSSMTFKKRTMPFLSNIESDAETISKFITAFTEDNSLHKLIISEPNEFRGINLSRYIEILPWNDMSFTKSFENSLARGLQIVLCRKRSNMLAIAPNIESFPVFKSSETKAQDCIQPNRWEVNLASRVNFFFLPIHIYYYYYSIFNLFTAFFNN